MTRETLPRQLRRRLRRAVSRTAGRVLDGNPYGPGPLERRLERRWRERARFWLRGCWSDAVVAERLRSLNATELERRIVEHADADGLLRLPTMTNEPDTTGSWPSTGRLLDTGPLPELVPGQFGERVKAEWLPWVRAAAEGASPDELRALEPPGFVAGEPMTMLEPAEGGPSDRRAS